ncbi:MAG: hypothetical protein R2780_10075 [Crocinitomicaceae bacterium]
MKNLTPIILLCLAPTFALAGTPDDAGRSEKMTTLFQCGVGTESGFNGWKVNGTSHETITYFEKDHIELFNHNPGNFSISFEKKIDEMIGFTDLQLSADIATEENCIINNATAYLSVDGKHWIALNKDVRDGAATFTKQMNYLYLKLVADVTFFKEGRFRFNKAVVYGDFDSEKLLPKLEDKAISNCPNMNQMKAEFFVFSFEKKVNIETQSEDEYEFVLSNLQGQIIMRSTANGSKRFMTDVPDGVYYVSILQKGTLVRTVKIVL